MNHNAAITNRDMRVTFRSIDENEQSIAVVRQARGRSGRERNINFVLSFSDPLVYQRFLKGWQQGHIAAGNEVLLHLQQQWDEAHSSTTIVDFSLLPDTADPSPSQEIAVHH